MGCSRLLPSYNSNYFGDNKYDLEPLANYEFAQLMPYRFTGKFTDFNTGLTQMDARWYNPHTARFLQPDYWNLRNTHLPAEIQHELMQFAGLNTQQLLRDPAQQMAYGYVRGNPLSYVDPMGLAYLDPLGTSTIRGTGYDVVDTSSAAVEHYFDGGGRSVELGEETKNEIKNNKRGQVRFKLIRVL